MDFLTFLKDYENEDVSSVKGIYESNKAKETAIIKEAFNSEYPSKKEALFNLENYFVESKSAPKTIDTDYAKNNLEDLKSKIEQLDEGDIRIIIHNHENTKDDSEVGFAEEGAKPKRKRGRPAKAKAVVLGEPVVSEPTADDVIADVEPVIPNAPSAEPDIITDMGMGEDDIDVTDELGELGGEEDKGERWSDVVPEVLADLGEDDEDVTDDESLLDEIKPEKVRWSDIVKKVSEQNETKDELIEQLAGLALEDGDLKQATAMAESGEIVEDGGPVSQAASLISQINSM